MLIGLSVIAWLFDVDALFFIVGGLAVLSLVPVFAKGINWSWMKFAQVLGWINSRILLTVVYFIILVPVALISRMFNKDPLKLKWHPDLESYFEVRDHTYTKGDLQNPW